jgi:predicted 2-oxoglutarate/Fe(II)-dependent dioxygenase YbiX
MPRLDRRGGRLRGSHDQHRQGAGRDAGLRNNSRAIRDDPALAADLWQRLRQHVPPFLDGRQAIGINQRVRFYRYDPAQYFGGHVDGVFRRGNGEESRLTLMVYLNDDVTGGETAFADTVIVPSTGLALLFRHELFHEGRPVTAGVKHVLRSDVMYGPVGRLHT